MLEPRVCAVVVAWRPDPVRLRALLDALAPQVAMLAVVDNGGAAAVLDERVACLPQGGNAGLAAGFNAGIAWARAQGATHVLLSDQDSLPAAGMVAGLLRGEERLHALGRPLAAVGPRYIDVKTGERQPVQGPEACYLRRKQRPDFEQFTEAGYLISSGKLIALSVLDRVGAMREDLFIDAVDIEWCLRAAGAGLRCYAVEDAAMRHDIGDAVVRVGGARKALHSPLRHYYIVRNALLLLRDRRIPWRWKVGDGLKTARRIAAFPLLSQQPLQELKWIARAVRDGLCGIAGKADYPDGIEG